MGKGFIHRRQISAALFIFQNPVIVFFIQVGLLGRPDGVIAAAAGRLFRATAS
jgi:hypothetical protein